MNTKQVFFRPPNFKLSNTEQLKIEQRAIVYNSDIVPVKDLIDKNQVKSIPYTYKYIQRLEIISENKQLQEQIQQREKKLKQLRRDSDAYNSEEYDAQYRLPKKYVQLIQLEVDPKTLDMQTQVHYYQKLLIDEKKPFQIGDLQRLVNEVYQRKLKLMLEKQEEEQLLKDQKQVILENELKSKQNQELVYDGSQFEQNQFQDEDQLLELEKEDLRIRLEKEAAMKKLEEEIEQLERKEEQKNEENQLDNRLQSYLIDEWEMNRHAPFALKLDEQDFKDLENNQQWKRDEDEEDKEIQKIISLEKQFDSEELSEDFGKSDNEEEKQKGENKQDVEKKNQDNQGESVRGSQTKAQLLISDKKQSEDSNKDSDQDSEEDQDKEKEEKQKPEMKKSVQSNLQDKTQQSLSQQEQSPEQNQDQQINQAEKLEEQMLKYKILSSQLVELNLGFIREKLEKAQNQNNLKEILKYQKLQEELLKIASFQDSSYDLKYQKLDQFISINKLKNF